MRFDKSPEAVPVHPQQGNVFVTRFDSADEFAWMEFDSFAVQFLPVANGTVEGLGGGAGLRRIAAQAQPIFTDVLEADQFFLLKART